MITSGSSLSTGGTLMNWLRLNQPMNLLMIQNYWILIIEETATYLILSVPFHLCSHPPDH